MKKNRFSLSQKILLGVNALLLFIVAFQIGGRLAKAQMVYFDEPQQTIQSQVAATNNTQNPVSRAELEALLNRPATAQYTEFKDQISSVVSPENPGPEQLTNISLSTYSFDINSAEITWKVNGKEIRKGLGIKNFGVVTGKAGTVTTVSVTIDPKDRPIITKTFTFKPGEVDLLWQSDVYTHPFYRGKKLYTPESNLTFVAMPRNTNGIINPASTVFNWRVNGNNQADKSGFGKSSYSFEGPIILRPVEVEVEAYTPSKNAGNPKEVATAEITIQPKSSGVLLYENSPLYGVLFNRALRGNLNLDKEEMGISAYPYFQTIENKNVNVDYLWIVDTYPVDISPTQNTITLRRVQADSGRSTVAVRSQNPLKILQTAQTFLNISFDRPIQDNTSANEFGN